MFDIIELSLVVFKISYQKNLQIKKHQRDIKEN